MKMKLLRINTLICSALISTLIWAQTSTSTSTSTATDYTGGAASAAAAGVAAANQVNINNQAALDTANATLASDQAKLEDAQAGLDRNLINQRQAELAQAQAVCPSFVPGNGVDTFNTGTCGSQQAINDITTAYNNLRLAQIPHYDIGLVNRLAAQVEADKNAVRQAGYEKEYGMISSNGAAALSDAMDDINNKINTNSTDILNNPSGMLAPLSSAASGANLLGSSGSTLTAEEQYRDQLKKDVINVIIGQITSRLNACDHTDDLEKALGAAALFMAGEAAIYEENRVYQQEMRTFLNNSTDTNRQKAYLTKLLQEYDKMITSAGTKQQTRDSAFNLFYTAASIAQNAAVSFSTKDIMCKTEAEMKAAQGINQAKEEKRNDDLAIIACSFSWCGACCAAPFVDDWVTADGDQNACSQGRDSIVQKIDDRTRHCNQLGTTKPSSVDMLRNYDSPTTTASKTIKDLCLSESDAIVRMAGGYCHNYSSNGGGPYTKCIEASNTFRQQMISCPVSILTDAAGEANAQAVVGTGVATGAVGAGAAQAGGTTGTSQKNVDIKLSGVDRAFIATTSLNIAKAVDLRMASPLQRSIIWSAFAQLSKVSAGANAQQLNEIQQNREHINDLLKALNDQAGGIDAGNVGSPLATLPGQSVSIHGSEAINYHLPSETACITGASSTSCKSATDSARAMPGFASLSPAMQTQSLNAAAVVNTVNRTSNITSAGLTAMKNFNNNSGAILANYNKGLSQLQNVLTVTDPKLNLDSETKKMKSSIDSALRSASQKIGSSSVLSNEFANSNLAQSAANKKISIKDKKVEALNSPIALSQIPTIDSKVSSSGLVASANIKPNEDNTLLMGVIEARDHNGKAKYIGNDEDSLFEKLTKAYIRNYDKVLTRKAVAP